MQSDDPTHDVPLTASRHHHPHHIAPLAPGDGIDELAAPPRSRLRTPFGCFP